MELVGHGDDSTMSDNCDDLKKFAEDFRTKYIVKIREVLGPDRHDLKEITPLNRVFTWTMTASTLKLILDMPNLSSENLVSAAPVRGRRPPDAR